MRRHTAAVLVTIGSLLWVASCASTSADGTTGATKSGKAVSGQKAPVEAADTTGAPAAGPEADTSATE